ncbi:uncharacterized protein LOC135825264 [Sycon ciliatum]|uniref:uncharacterized protein LOC135825264 n=1 Tax=Sycon ciliatum TaxID=27933 RepID=UPI0031F69AD3
MAQGNIRAVGWKTEEVFVESGCLSDQNFIASTCRHQGVRPHMEDEILAVHDISPECQHATTGEHFCVDFFAVCDGHGGGTVSKAAVKHLPDVMDTYLQFLDIDLCTVLPKVFHRTDDVIKFEHPEAWMRSGSTVIGLARRDNFLYVANAGDSRAVSSIGGYAVALSKDMKPSDPEENARILSQGGRIITRKYSHRRVKYLVDYEEKVLLNVSGGFGDGVFKKGARENWISQATPEMMKLAITTQLEFVILASDGLWDVFTNEEAVKFVRNRMRIGCPPEELATQLVNYAVNHLHTQDNVSAIVYLNIQNRDYSALLDQVRYWNPIVEDITG